MTLSFPAMGTTVDAWLGDAGQAELLRSWFRDVESTCSRFREDSELSRINASPAVSHRISPTLASILHSARRVRDLTHGLVDVGVGAAVSGWGYDRTFADVSDLTTLPIVAGQGQWEILGRELRRTSDTKLDVGGIAKGWTCDAAVEQGKATVVSAGGDLRSTHPDTTVSITDQNDEVVTRVQLGIGALATSSTRKRSWLVAGKEVSHLIDPSTMRPVHSPVVSATVIAETAVEAEAGAKAVILQGADGLAWADEQDWIGAAIAIWYDGSVFATTGIEVAA